MTQINKDMGRNSIYLKDRNENKIKENENESQGPYPNQNENDLRAQKTPRRNGVYRKKKCYKIKLGQRCNHITLTIYY